MKVLCYSGSNVVYNTIEMCNGIMFDFYPRLSHVSCFFVTTINLYQRTGSFSSTVALCRCTNNFTISLLPLTAANIRAVRPSCDNQSEKIIWNWNNYELLPGTRLSLTGLVVAITITMSTSFYKTLIQRMFLLCLMLLRTYFNATVIHDIPIAV